MAESQSPSKSVHSIVLDAGPIIKNTPTLSTLLAQSEELITTPSVVSEIRDPDARARIETLYLPFVKQRSPTPKSISVLSEFARKTGDRAVLSKTDIEVLALAYEVECERNGGDWRLRSVPGQKHVNGKPPVKEEAKNDAGEDKKEEQSRPGNTEEKGQDANVQTITEEMKAATIEEDKTATTTENSNTANAVQESDDTQADQTDAQDNDGSDSDSGGWITPSNLKKRQTRDEGASSSTVTEPKMMQVATITTDFAVSSVKVL